MVFLAVTSRESSRLPLLKLSKGGHHNHLTKSNLQNILSCTAFIIPGSGNHLGTMSVINTGALEGEWSNHAAAKHPPVQIEDDQHRLRVLVLADALLFFCPSEWRIPDS